MMKERMHGVEKNRTESKRIEQNDERKNVQNRIE